MIELGDCRALLKNQRRETFDSCVTDPPYEIGLLGNSWDSTGVAFDTDTWRQVIRVLKPGAHLIAFSSPRTYHRMVCAIEDAGFVVRDQIAWMKGGAAMPKGGRLSPKIDKALGAKRKVIGKRTLSGSAALSIKEKGGTYGVGQDSRGKKVEVEITEAGSEMAEHWEGWASNLAPRFEPILLAQKPYKGSCVRNVMERGVGAINTGGCAIPVEGGGTRWPPNGVILHSAGCSRELGCEPHCPADILAGQSGETRSAGNKRPTSGTGAFFGRTTGRKEFDIATVAKGDSGACDRYFPRFYWHKRCPKSEKTAGGVLDVPESLASVKPLGLIEWLVKLVTPSGGYCLDPFAGGGTTRIACHSMGIRHYGCESNESHYEYANARFELMAAH